MSLDSNKKSSVQTQSELSELLTIVLELEKSETYSVDSQPHLIKGIINAPMPVTITSVETGLVVEVNDIFLKRTGYRREEIINQPVPDLFWIVPEEKARFDQVLRHQGFVKFMEVTLGGINGSQNRGFLVCEPIEYARQKCLLSVFLDYDGYLHAIHDLNRSQERLNRLNRALLVKSKCSQVQVHATEELVLMQDICRILIEVGGYRLAWVGLVEHDLAKTVRPVAYSGYDEGYLANLQVNWNEADTRGKGPVGRSIRSGCPVSAQNILTEPGFEPWREEAHRRGYAALLVLPLLAESQVFGVSTLYSAQAEAFDAEETQLLMEMANDLAYGIVALRSRKERQRIEEALRLSEEKLKASQRMEAIGRLAGGIAHDFNNLLTAIFGYTNLLLVEPDPSQWNREDIIEIDKAAQRAAALTQQLLAFSRKQVLQPRIIDLNTVVIDTEKMLGRLIGENIELITSTDPQLGQVQADPDQIAQVIMNLAVNGRDAMPTGGKLFIETHNVTLDAEYASSHVAVEPGEYVQLNVTDTGEGMEAGTLSQIFEPFYTTKEQGKGTGLGLSTVYGIVKQSGGNIWVYSEPGKGSSFKIYLPRINAQITPPATQPPVKRRSLTGTETILVVEDEEKLRKLLLRVLGKAGYRVLEAGNGYEAMDIYRKQAEEIQLVITDLVMPGMGGLELAEQLHQLNPQLHFIFTSGYSDRAIEYKGTFSNNAAFIEKPFTLNMLSEKVRQLLDQV